MLNFCWIWCPNSNLQTHNDDEFKYLKILMCWGLLRITIISVGKLLNEVRISPADSRYRSHDSKTLTFYSFIGFYAITIYRQVSASVKAKNINNNNNPYLRVKCI